MKKIKFVLAFLLLVSQLFAQTWTPQTSGTSADVWGVHFPDALNGWACGSGGLVLHTTDAGQNWLPQNSNQPTVILRNVFFLDASTGWLVGDQGTVLKTTDGGATWVAQNSTTSSVLRQISFSDANNGWLCGASGALYHTTNGGTNWSIQPSLTLVGLMSIQFTDAQNGWTVGSSGGTNQNAIRHTTNGGTNWTQQVPPNVNNLNHVSMVDANHGWAAGALGTVIVTTDGGTNWTAQTTPITSDLRGLSFPTLNDGWAVGDSGRIIGTSDGGTTWGSQSSGVTTTFRNTFFPNSQSGWAVGNGGTILKYTGPSALQVQLSVTPVGCHGDSSGIVVAFGNGGTLPYTYAWSNGATSAAIVNVFAGTYTCTVTDASGNAVVGSATVTEPSGTALACTTTHTDVIVANDGTANAVPSGGTTPYSYLWSNGATTQGISGLPGGIYTVTVTDANACQTTASTTVLGITAIDPAASVAGFRYYPNPCHGAFTVALAKPGFVTITNSLGQVVQTANMTGQTQVIQVKVPGVYYLRAAAGDEVVTARIVNVQ